MLAIGIAVGAVITEVFARGDQNTTATTTVDTSVLPQGGAGDAVSVAQRLGPAVGTIVNRGTGGQTALGSGFVISHAGGVSYMLTNNHVVNGATDLRLVMPDGQSLKATVVGTDATDDLAVISVPDADAKLPTAVFGKSSDLKVGQTVVAIGSPLGNQGSVTEGVISALHRNITASDQGNAGPGETLLDVLQTDASINPGNSGGPLADTQGRVVGVNVANSSQGQSIGFSIPSDVAQRVATDLIAHKTVHVPYIGVGSRDPVSAAEAGSPFDGPGVVVTQVQTGTPAAQAGIQVGDILVSIDGVTLENGQTLGGVLQRHRAGDQVPVTLRRGGQTINATVTLAERPANLNG
jgi:S1-C subfamily serine protease